MVDFVFDRLCTDFSTNFGDNFFMLLYNDSIDDLDSLSAYLGEVGLMIDSLLKKLGMSK